MAIEQTPSQNVNGAFLFYGGAGAVLALVSVALLLLRLPVMLEDPDFWWHLAAGRYVLEHGLPAMEPFSWTAGNYAWLNHSWVFDGMLALGGERGALVLALMGAVGLMVGVGHYFERRAVPFIWAVSLGLVMFLLMAKGMMPRPQMVGYAALMLMLGRLKRRAGWPDLVILWVWALCHGSWPLWFVALGVRGQWVSVLGWMAAGLAVVCLTPLGLDVFAAVERTLGGALVGVVQEWRGLAWPEDAVALVGMSLVLGLCVWRRNKVGWQGWVCLLVGFGLVSMGVRNVPFFAVWAMPGLAMAFGSDVTEGRRGGWGAYVLLLLLCLAPLFGVGGGRAPGALIASMAQALDGQGRVLNHYGYGGMVSWFGEGRLKVFIDGRAETAYPPELVQDYLALAFQRPGWQEVLARYQPQAALLPVEDPLAVSLEGLGWREVMRGQGAVWLEPGGNEP